MFGFVVGTLCLFGLVGLVKGRGGCHGGRHGGRTGGSRSHGKRGMGRAVSELLKRRLGIDEDQEDLVDLALNDLRAAGSGLRSTFVESRSDLAKAFAGESVDDASLEAIFAIHDEALHSARRDAVSALRQVHSVLTPEQRTKAASMLGQDGSGWGWM